jgi:hypothetical protein
MDNSIQIEVYKNVFENWRSEVNSYWERTKYFAALETAALAGCGYLLGQNDQHFSKPFCVLGMLLTLVWFWSNFGVHRYIAYWFESAKAAEKAMSLSNSGLDFATKHLGNRWRPSLAIQVVPLLFTAAWAVMILVAFGWPGF